MYKILTLFLLSLSLSNPSFAKVNSKDRFNPNSQNEIRAYGCIDGAGGWTTVKSANSPCPHGTPVIKLPKAELKKQKLQKREALLQEESEVELESESAS